MLKQRGLYNTLGNINITKPFWLLLLDYDWPRAVQFKCNTSGNRPLSHGGHFESQENKKLCFCASSLALDERLAVQNLLFQHCVIKVYSVTPVH